MLPLAFIKIALVQVIGRHFRPIIEQNYHLEYLPIIKVNRGQVWEAVRLFGNGRDILSDKNTRDELTQALAVPSNGFAVFMPTNPKSTEKTIQTLAQILKCGHIGSQPLRSLPAIITDEQFYLSERQNIMVLDLGVSRDDLREFSLNTSIETNELYKVLGEIKEYEEANTDVYFLEAMAFSLKPALQRAGELEAFNNLLEIARQLSLQDESDRELDEDMAGLFVDCFYNYIQAIKSATIYELPNITMGSINDASAFFYSSDYIFMSEEAFKDICSPLLHTYSIGTIKRQLSSEGLLKGSNDTYTAKMSYCSVAGTLERKRMLRFLRDLLTKPGELGIVEILLLNRASEKEV